MPQILFWVKLLSIVFFLTASLSNWAYGRTRNKATDAALALQWMTPFALCRVKTNQLQPLQGTRALMRKRQPANYSGGCHSTSCGAMPWCSPPGIRMKTSLCQKLTECIFLITICTIINISTHQLHLDQFQTLPEQDRCMSIFPILDFEAKNPSLDAF